MLFFFLMTGIILQIGLPQMISTYIDSASIPNGYGTLVFIALSFIGLALVNQLVQLGAAYFGESIAWVSTNILRSQLAIHSLHLELSFHKEHTAGEMIERIDGDVTALANFFSHFIIQLVGNMLLLVGVIVVIFFQNAMVGTVFLVFTLFVFVVLNKIRNFATPYWMLARQARAAFFGFLGEKLAGIEDVRANGAASHLMNRFFQSTRYLLDKERPAYIRARSLWPAMIVLFAIGYTAIFLTGSYLLQKDAITLGAMFLMFYYLDTIRAPLETITLQMEDFQKASASINRIQGLLSMISSITDNEQAQLSKGALSVELQDVSFGYEPNLNVFTSLNFTLPQGSVLGLLGRTGSGKTTISRLLLRLYEPQSGNVLLGGTNIRHLARADLLANVAVVTQSIKLFHATVRDNVTLFNRDISDEKIVSVLEDVGLGDWVRNLPNGLDTMQTGATGGMSAGQAQLLSFARAFLKDSGLIILDEASSRLDPRTEQLISKALEKLLTGRTAIIIAHRLQTVQKVDKVMILEQGRIAEYGDRRQLERDPQSHYSSLLQAGMEEVMQ